MPLQGLWSDDRLKSIWKLLRRLEAEPEAGWDQLADWRLLPLQDKSRIKIEHRGIVFAHPGQEMQTGSYEGSRLPLLMSASLKSRHVQAGVLQDPRHPPSHDTHLCNWQFIAIPIKPVSA